MIRLEPHSEGVVVAVRAQPGARADEIRGEHGGALKVCVTPSPERGKANRAIIGLLSKALSLRKSQIELIAGATSHEKRFLIRGMTAEALAERLGRFT